MAFNTMHEVESTPNKETYNSLIYGYGRGGLTKEAEAVVLRMNAAWMERDTHSFTGLVEAYCQGGKYDNAVKAYVEMQKSRCSPSERTLEAVLCAYCMAELVDESREQFEEIRSARGAPSIMAYCMMLSLYAKLDRYHFLFYLSIDIWSVCAGPPFITRRQKNPLKCILMHREKNKQNKHTTYPS